LKRAAAVLAAAGVIAGLGLATSALSDETDYSRLKMDIAKLMQGQQTVLDELKAIREELHIVKIRCSS
jgi:hypothetical protein